MAGGGDGDIGIFVGFNNSVINCRVHNYAAGDATKTCNHENAVAIMADQACRNTRIIGNYVYGGGYGIDVKGGAWHTVVQGNTVEKCWVGIAVREGEIPAPPSHTVIDGNTVIPNGGNGKTGALFGLTFDGANLTTTGIAVMQYNFGVAITNNIIGNQFYEITGTNNFLDHGLPGQNGLQLVLRSGHLHTGQPRLYLREPQRLVDRFGLARPLPAGAECHNLSLQYDGQRECHQRFARTNLAAG
jgi:hypothetical protein